MGEAAVSELRAGDPVTIAYWAGGGRELIRAEVSCVVDSGFFWRRILAEVSSASPRYTADEGVTWVRGWTGPAVNALLAVAALTS